MRRDRAARVGDEMQKMIADILRNDIKDPRIPVMTSVVEVKMLRIYHMRLSTYQL